MRDLELIPPYPEYIFDEKSFAPKVRCERQTSHFYALKTNPGYGPPTLHSVTCKARRCEKCGWFWSWKWQLALSAKAEQDELLGLPKIRRAVTLTTSYDPGYQKCWLALKRFWGYLRAWTGEPKAEKEARIANNRRRRCFGIPPVPPPPAPYKDLKYWGVVEYNQLHTQPHFHFVLSGDAYIPKMLIRSCWKKAQRAADFDKIAFDTRIEQINKNMQAYFTKYLSKATGGKDEIPRPENWNGRFVRYTLPRNDRPGFFACPVPAIMAGYNLKKMLQRDDCGRIAVLINSDTTLEEFIASSQIEFKELRALVRKDWSYTNDQARATTVSATLFDVPVVHEMARPPVKPKINLLPPRPPADLIEAWNVRTAAAQIGA